MSIRSLIITLVLGCVALGCVDEGNTAEDLTGTAEQHISFSYWCSNQVLGERISCQGLFNGNKIEVTIDDIKILSDKELDVLARYLKYESNKNKDTDIGTALGNLKQAVLDVYKDEFGIILFPIVASVCAPEIASCS